MAGLQAGSDALSDFGDERSTVEYDPSVPRAVNLLKATDLERKRWFSCSIVPDDKNYGEAHQENATARPLGLNV